MKCVHIVFLFVIALSVWSPAMYAVYAVFNLERPIDHPMGGAVVVGGLQLIAAAVWAFMWVSGKVAPKAKAELDALKAGMRGEG